MATAPIKAFSDLGRGTSRAATITPDFELRNEFTIFVLRPLTDEGRDWINENIPENAMTWAGGVVIEHRYVADIIAGVVDSGLTIAGDE
jgi:hypothetical protein